MSENTNTPAAQGTREAAKEQAAAVKLDGRIRTLATQVDNKTAELNALISTAIETKAYILVGFGTWQEYLSDVCAKNMPNLDAVNRNQLIRFLRASGMSVRAVATALNTSAGTVSAVDNGSSTGEPQNQMGKGGSSRKGVAQSRRTPATIAIDAIEAAVKKLPNTSLADMQALHAKLTGTALVVEAAIKAYTDRQAALIAEEAAKEARKAQHVQGNQPRTGVANAA